MRSRLKKPLLPCSLGLVGLACAFGTAPAHAQRVSSVVWMSDTCEASRDPDAPKESPLGAILGIVLGPLIETGVKGLGDAIAKAGAPSDIHAVGSLHSALYTVDVPWQPNAPVQPRLAFARECLVAAFGPAKDGENPLAAAARLQAEGTRPLTAEWELESAVVTQLAEALIPERTSILVASLELSADRTAFRLVPQYLRFGQAFDGKRKARSVSFTASILLPSGTADGSAVAIRTIAFPEVTQAADLKDGAAQLHTTSWMPLPPAPDGIKARIDAAAQRMSDAYAMCASLAGGGLSNAERAKAAAEIDRLGNLLVGKRKPADSSNSDCPGAASRSQDIGSDRASLKSIAPMTIRADIHEARPGNTFLIKLGALLSGNAEKLATPLANAINPETRADEAETETQRVEALRILAITEAGNLVEAKTAGDTAAQRSAELKLGAACRQIEDADFSEIACVVGP